MDESSLEAAIETYHAQLKQVESALGAGLDSSQESDLLKLKDDLQQLIQLTESSLVSVKKSRLLASLEEATAPQSASRVERTEVGNMDEEFAAFYSEVGGTSVECMSGSMEEPFNSQIASSSSPGHTSEVDDEDGDEDIDANADDDGDDGESLSGLKVRAPYRTSWGTLEYHNAMVVGPEYSEGSEPHVRVLYVYPTNKSMKPCPFFLENRCRFMEDCRFSHGEVVSVSELRDFQDTDLSNLQEGSSCLARHEDGIWYPAKITEIDGGYYTVKFDSLLQKDLVIEADGIIPPMREDDSPSSESDDDDPEYSAFAKVVDSNETETWAPGSTSDFGGWEAHTRGIGSKLMSKMGYEFGKAGVANLIHGEPVRVFGMTSPSANNSESPGLELRTTVLLWADGEAIPKTRTHIGPPWNRFPTPVVQDVFCLGRNGEGRVEPVLAVVLPKGRSLDHCVETVQKKALGKGGTEASAKRRKKKAKGTGASQGRRDVFDFLNSKLGDQEQKAVDAPAPQRNSKEVYRGGKGTKRSINVRLFQTAERVAQTEREIDRLTEALGRKAGRDKAMISHLEEKLSGARRLLSQLKAQELSIQMERKKADTHKKMTEF